MEHMQTETYKITYTIFEQIVELTIENEDVTYRFYNSNNGEWVEHLSQVKSNWSFQDPNTEEKYNHFLEEVAEFIPEIAEWTDGMEVDEKITNEYGHEIEKLDEDDDDDDSGLEVTIENAEAVLDGTVKPHGNGARVTVPKKYIGKNVKIVILQDD